MEQIKESENRDNQPKISVIVPVYNVEKYLRRCIDSILAQTFTDFEVLLIDDGSTDTSGKICDEYAEKDNRVRVFHKKNGGVSSARNKGLDNARGEWICFVDADDWLYNNKTFNIPNAILFSQEINIIEIPYFRGKDFNNNKSKFYKDKQVITYYSKFFHNELWGRFYSCNLIGKHRFIESLKIGEDVVFFFNLYSEIRGVYVSSNGSYCYTINPTSTMRNVNMKFELQQIDYYLEKIKKLNLGKNNIIEFAYKTLSYLLNRKIALKIRNIDLLINYTFKDIFYSDLPIKEKIRFFFLLRRVNSYSYNI